MPELSRRHFLQALATSAVGAVVFTGCADTREGLVESRVVMAEDTLSANDDWYATTCRECEAGCGLLVRVVEGRAKKAEGNPDHPINQGKLCVRGQATVQAEYHPDRFKGPQQRLGARGSGTFAPIDWETGLDRLGSRMRDLHQQARGTQVVIITRPLRAHQALLMGRFANALNAQWLSFESVGEAPLREAVQRVYGPGASLPAFDIENADYILSFGADFLTSWLSPVRYSSQYGVFRQGSYRPGQSGQARPRGKLVALEPRFSPTAAAADTWVPTRPGTEGLLALSIAQAITGAADRSAFAPEQTEAATGVAAARVREIADDFRAAQRPLAIGGGSVGAHTNGSDALAAIIGLNTLVPSPSLGATPPAPLPEFAQAPAAARIADWRALVDRLRAGQVDTVVVLDANPVHGLPAALGLGDALRDRAPFIASFSGLLDETTALADIVLPANAPLEDWGDDAPGANVIGLQQPLLRPLYDTRGFWDVLLMLGEEIGGSVHQALPWTTFKDALRDGASAIQRLDRGSVRDADFERFWVSLLQRGGWWEAPTSGSPGQAAPGALPSTIGPANFDGAADTYPFHLLVYEHNSLGDGRGAFLPWLQAAPEPLTSAVWQTWVELNPALARSMGVVEGDVMALESTVGRIEVPAYIHPAAPPDVLGVPLGQGHAYGRWARNRGANPLDLVAPLEDAGSGALAYAATRVRLSRTGRHVPLPKLEGTVPAYQLPGQEVIKISAS